MIGTIHRRKIAGRSLLYLVLSLGAFVAMMPLLYMIANSLKTYSETVTRISAIPFDPRFWPKKPMWENYERAWNEASMGRYFVNSIIISMTTVVGVVIVSCLAAYSFSKLRYPGKSAIFAIVLATLMIPETVLLIPNFITVSTFGWVNRLAALTVPFMGSAFYIFLMRQFFNQIPDALVESARIDSATHMRILTTIFIPLSTAPIFTMSFLAFTGAWNALGWPLVVTTSPKWRPISVGLMTFITEAGPETHLRMAGAMIAILPIVGVYVIAQRQITEAISRTGLKG